MQRQVIALIGTLIFVVSSKADLNSKIDELNSAVKSVGAPKADCETCTTMVAGKPEDDGSLMQSCVESICANAPVSLAKIVNTAHEKAAQPQAIFEKEIAPIIKKTALQEAAHKLVRVENIRDWIKTAPAMTDPGGIKIFNLMVAYGELSKAKITTDAQNSMVVDRTETRAAFPHLNEAQFEQKMTIFSKIVSTMGANAIASTDPATVQLQYGEKFLPTVNAILADIEAKKKSIQANPEFRFLAELENFQELGATEKLRAAFASGRIDPTWIQELNSTSSTMTLFSSIASDEKLRAALQSESVDIKKKYDEMGFEKLFAERSNKQSEILKPGANPQSSMCQTAFALAQEVLPTQAQVDAFKARMPALREKFQASTKGIVCEAFAAQTKKQLDQLEPLMPMTQEQYLQTMKEALLREQASVQKEMAKTGAVMRSANRNTLYALSLSSFDVSESEPTSSSDAACANLIVDPSPDATTYDGKTFVAGPMPVKHEHAEGICHHELGHKLAFALKYQSRCEGQAVLKVSQCLVENHTEFDANEKAQALGDIQGRKEFKYGEEDWADLIGAQVESGSNPVCAHATRLKKQDYKDLSLKNANSADSHSSPLFRLLHIQFLKTGKIPQTCEAALSQRGEKAQFKNCLVK